MTDQKITTFQLFGERCSGTNYTAQLLQNNFPDIELRSVYGFKHHHHNKDLDSSESCLFITVYRDVFDWLRSFHLKPYHAAPELRNISFSEFIRKEWQGVYTQSMSKTPDDPLWGKEMMSERDPESGNRFNNVLEIRKSKANNWEALSNRVNHFIHIRYEDLRDNPELMIQEVSAKYNVTKSKNFIPVSSYKGEEDQKNFVQKKYKAICPNDISYILSKLDLSLEDSLGYNIEQRTMLLNLEWYEAELEKKTRLLEKITNGNSFKIGRLITWPARKIIKHSKFNA